MFNAHMIANTQHKMIIYLLHDLSPIAPGKIHVDSVHTSVSTVLAMRWISKLFKVQAWIVNLPTVYAYVKRMTSQFDDYNYRKELN